MEKAVHDEEGNRLLKQAGWIRQKIQYKNKQYNIFFFFTKSKYDINANNEKAKGFLKPLSPSKLITQIENRKQTNNIGLSK